MSTIAQERAESGYALDADEGEAFWLLGMLQTIKIGKDDTAGKYGLLEIVVPEGVGSPWHVHPEEDEWFYVLEGELTIWVAGETVVAVAGAFVFGPRDVPHTFVVSSEQARFLLVTEPAGFEGFVRALGTPAAAPEIPPAPTAAPDMAPVLQAAEDHGLEILGPPGIPG
jgi:quercetin dioxygenase-like cupin family protein